MTLNWIDVELARLESSRLLRQRVAREGTLGATICVDDQRYLNFGSNDYLGIASDPSLAKVAAQTVTDVGWGSGASSLILGRTALHAELEQQLAEFMGSEAALLFPTGFAANVGTIPALVGKDDVIFSDAKNHASIIDGCRLSRATIKVYPHNDLAALSSMLQTAGTFAKRLIVSDSLFSMDGDLALVHDLAELAERFDAMLMIDEAHALGVFGPNGAGICSQADIAGRVPIRVGTLSKAFGSQGGFVAGSSSLIEYLANRARAYVFSTASPATTAAIGLAALRLIANEPQRRERLLATAARICDSLVAQGWNVPNTGTHIVPVVIGDPSETLRIAELLKYRNCWVPCIRPPSVPVGESLLRISLTSAHTDAMIEDLLAAFADAKGQ